MTNYDKFISFLRKHKDDSWNAFFDNLAKEFDVSQSTAYSIWYAEQRSWFRPEMIDELIRLDKAPKEEFRPSLASGEFQWKNGKFLPEDNS